ncbi:hypothetical protein DIURU_002117 [Diutina rugosa]|uniref:Ubiquitin-like domain-containing protein n=1 Tax=Diutina rugosa TaxID=5481 RepID=A0A642UR82_DIURU|nr:uncharacterized protein DIURU_002117 [Diutina rugosa]KAA8903895.1 hypothetical protein DIURU_002117 [Diutina rugosa]
MIDVIIKSSGDTKYELSIDSDITVAELKQQISEKSGVDADEQRLIYSGKVLKDDQKVEFYKVQSGHAIHMVKSAKKRTTETPSQAPIASGQATSGAPTNIATGTGAHNPLNDLTGARYAGMGLNLPSASMFGPDGGMTSAMPDPEQLSSMMSSPLFQEQMNAMLNDPQMMEFLFQQNPQLRSMAPQMRDMLQSPLFRQMMSNPELLRSMMEMNRGSGFGANMFGGSAADAVAGGFPAPGTPGGSTSHTDRGVAENPNNTGSTASPNPALNPFTSLFPGGLGAFGGMQGFGESQSPADTRPPEERYESQLRQLNDMGFVDFDANIRALQRCGGSVQGAIEQLLSGNSQN